MPTGTKFELTWLVPLRWKASLLELNRQLLRRSVLALVVDQFRQLLAGKPASVPRVVAGLNNGRWCRLIVPDTDRAGLVVLHRLRGVCPGR